jgi:hypothetical protein
MLRKNGEPVKKRLTLMSKFGRIRMEFRKNLRSTEAEEEL